MLSKGYILAILVMGVSISTIFGITEFSVKTSMNSYSQGDRIEVFGQVSEIIEDTLVTVQIINEGNLVDIAQVPIEYDGKYEHIFIGEGPLWQEDGTYVVRASYGTLVTETSFQFSSKPSEPTFPEPVPEPKGESGYFLLLVLPVSEGENFSIYADYNEANNFQRLKEIVLDSNQPLDLLGKISNEMMEGDSIATKNVHSVNRWNADGIETLEYGKNWTKLRGYVDIGRITNQLIDMTNGGMSLNTAFSQFDHLLEKVEKPDLPTEPEPIKQIPKTTEKSLKEPRKNIFDFIDTSNGKQYYLDRYYNEPAYREWFDTNFPDYSIEDAIAIALSEPLSEPEPEPVSKVPEWVRNIFIWYAEERISEDDLLGAIQFLLDQGILKTTNS